jgi:tyrosyl-DNA phosphodiesterase 2
LKAPPQPPRKKLSELLEEGALTTKAPDSLVFVTWNIDGLDQRNLRKRTKAVCKILELEAADIVFLQEVVPETFSYLESKLPGYQCLAGRGSQDYFVATLLRRGRVYLDSHSVLDFPSSRMGRHVLAAEAHCGSVKLRLLNTHLESTAEHKEERTDQLRRCLGRLAEGPGAASVLAGDLNMRDAELAAVGGLPARATDVWEACGARQEARYTWDMQRNDNLQANFGKFRPRCRFDRIYLRDSEPGSVAASEFGLVGLQRITGTQAFPSDHWGLRARLSLTQGPPQARKRKADEA